MKNRLCCNQKDPTRTAFERRKAFATLRKLKDAVMKEIRQYVQNIPHSFIDIDDAVKLGNSTVKFNRRVYTFELGDRDVYKDIQEIVARWFQTGGDAPPPRWFFDSEVERITRRAAAQQMERVNRLSEITGGLPQYDTEKALRSPEFAERIRRIRSRVFEEMKGFTGDTANVLARALSDGMARGVGVRTITGSIAKQFDIKESRARTIIRTEFGNAHRNTIAEQSKDARDRLGLNIGIQWISALAPTTRPEHAERHLKIYTIEQVADFYARDANAINCLCTQQDVIIEGDGVIGERKETAADRAAIKKLTGK